MPEVPNGQSALSFPVQGNSTAIAPAKTLHHQFLRLGLGGEIIALLPIWQLSEVLKIPRHQIVPIPQMEPWTMGVYNWRGDILWVVDLGHLCGFTPWYQRAMSSPVFNAVVLQVNDFSAGGIHPKKRVVGLIVSAVEDIEQCSPDMIRPLPTASPTPELERFLRGYWWKSDDSILAVLEGSAILKVLSQSQR